MFSPDKPINVFSEDLLNRTSFARHFADAILKYNSKESLVIGLCSEWGTGKTSILNLALQQVEVETKRVKKDAKPLIFKFSPWNFSDQNQLLHQFFKQLSLKLGKKDNSKTLIKAGSLIKTYSSILEPLSLLPVIGFSIDAFSKSLKGFGKTLEEVGNIKSKDLDDIKEEINKTLNKQKRKLLIIIDDIDRVANQEIKLIFQLVKSLCDFDNTIYILSFDKKIVNNALADVQGEYGEKYLEKIIQVQFDVPKLSLPDIHQLLFKRIDFVLNNLPEGKFDQIYWANLWHSGLKSYFKNLRDINRFINTLNFNYGIVKNEVNVVDFIAITVLQVFEWKLFLQIRDNKELFSGINRPEQNSRIFNQDNPQKAIMDRIIESSINNDIDEIKEILQRLFPKLGSIFGNSFYNYESLSSWRKNCRIASPDHFETYFRLQISKNDFSQTEIQEIIVATNNLELFRAKLLALNEEKRIIRFLELFEDYTEETIPEENIQTVISALLDIGDLFPEGDLGFTSIDTPMRILRICYQLSLRFKQQDKRFELFNNAIENSRESIFSIIHEVGIQDQQHGRYSDPGKKSDTEKTLTLEQVITLEKLAHKKIIEWAKAGKLITHKKLSSILFAWSRWGTMEEVKQFADDSIHTDENLIRFICSFVSVSHSIGGNDLISRVHSRIYVKNMAEYINIKEIELRIRKLISLNKFKNFSEEQKKSLQLFIDTIDGKIEDHF